MAYASISKPSLYFNGKTWTGTGASNSLTGIGFRPDWVWIKHREDVSNHRLFDSTRGANKNLKSNDTQAEITATDQLMSFDSDGFTVGADASVNGAGAAGVVAWCWKANAGTTSADSNGSISSVVQADTTAGFSIVKYTGTGSNATVGHGLGAVPGMILFKCTNDAQNWRVYHKGMDTSAPEDYALILNNSNTRDDDNTAFNDTAATTTTFGLGTTATINQNGNIHIAYAFAEKKGYSKFSSYTGNGSSDGPFVYTGFKPAWVMGKISAGSANNWFIFDTTRDTHNLTQRKLRPDTTAAENNNSSKAIDIYSNGFKIKNNDGEFNTNNSTYIYAAFAEEPLVANVGASIPATAR